MSDKEHTPEHEEQQQNETASTPKEVPTEPADQLVETPEDQSDLEKSIVAEREDKSEKKDTSVISESDDEDETPQQNPTTAKGTNKAVNVEEANDTAHEDAMVEESEKPSESSSTSKNSEDDTDHEDAMVAEASSKTPRDAQEEVDNAVAEDSEDESTGERHDIEKKNYEELSQEDLVKELETLLKNEKVQAIKEHVDEIRTEFNNKFDEESEQKKEEFLEEGGNIIDFHYVTPIKKKFDSVYFDYREKRNNHYKQLKRDLTENLKKREAIIEELKNMIGVGNDMHSNFNDFKKLQERWRQAGPIPRDKYNLVWNNYHHHVENFYDFLHLDREFRDLDFKHNLEQKLKVISRAEELAKETNVNRAFRELQMLHKMWKEDIGPVAKEHRDVIWDKFSALTKTIHDNRQAHYSELEKDFEKNLEKKNEIIAQIAEIANDEVKSHGSVQKKIKKVETLREAFFKAGKVPREKNQDTWDRFKKTVRQFNRNKNAFYKNQKQEQYDNLEKKKELIKIAEDNKDSDDFKTVTPLMKKIQNDWKKIGHVPRKDSDKIWKRFKSACNHYFDSLHAAKNEVLQEEKENLKLKQALLTKINEFKLTDSAENDLKSIKGIIKEWKEIGRVPYSKKNIEQDFNKVLDGLFKKLDLGRKESELIKYDNRVAAIADQDDDRQLNKERYFITKKIDEVKAEIFQLENNLGFFQHVSDDNPMVKEVHKNIADHKKTLEIWKAKLKKLKTLY